MKTTRIGSFLTSIVSLILACLMLYLVNDIGLANMDGIERLSLIVTVPIIIIFYCVLGAFCLTSIIYSIRSISSSSVTIKVISIILLIGSLTVTGFGVYLLRAFIIAL